MEISPVDRLEALSEDLVSVDLSLIEKEFEPLRRLESIEDQYDQLSLICRGKVLLHPQWLLLAGRVKTCQYKSQIPPTFSGSCRALRPILNDEYSLFVEKYKARLDEIIRPENDMNFDILAVETLLKSYLARIKKDSKTTILETPQYMYLRVAVYLWFTLSDDEEKIEESFDRIQRTYDDLTNGRYSHASPTLFNCGLFRPQLASCFTMNIGDNMQSISKGWHDTAIISMNSGGLGIDMTSLRHSEIGQYGHSHGIVPWIKIFDQILTTVDQGGKRQGSGTAYLCGWHIDIFEFLDLRKPSGAEQMRARNIFLAIMVSDEFMRRVEADEEWTLFCPNKAQGLDSSWGLDFETKYRMYEEKAAKNQIVRYRKIRARDLWEKIILSQIETGMPFIIYKDALNRKSNQKNLGTTRLSNLCTEISLFTDKDNIGSCNLGSIALNSCVKDIPKIPAAKIGNAYLYKNTEYFQDVERFCRFFYEKFPLYREIYSLESIALGAYGVNIGCLCNTRGIDTPWWWAEKYYGGKSTICSDDEEENEKRKKYFDFELLERLVRDMVRNINQVIDRNYYPREVPQIEETNMRNRPLGIGVMGLADVFAMMDLTWTSREASELNKKIFETMYYAAISESVQMAKESGAYETFEGSPMSQGLFQFDMWDMERIEKDLYSSKAPISVETFNQITGEMKRGPATDRYNWNALRQDMVEYGTRNSLLMALMPTASSASILKCNECFEPYTMHVYARTLLSGQFVIVNNHLVHDLEAIGLWNTETVRSLWTNNGRLSDISEEGLTNDQLLRMRFLKQKYLTAFEIPQKVLLDMSLERGRYVCQTQSLNCWMENPSYKKMNAFHFYGWKGGAKTGMYYLRQTAKTDPINFSIENIEIPTKRQIGKGKKEYICTDDVCLSCQ